VERLLASAQGEWLVIQDAARPFCSVELLARVVEAARESGVAGAFLGPDVPVALIEDGHVVQDFKPQQVGVFQAPQAYSRAVLERLYAGARQQRWQEQSTLQLALRFGLKVRAVAGEKTNIKLTTPEDWALAQGLVGYLQ
jgi:2-C-methyl-D-erythritol 4-phosphate cytidylyltransferase